MSNRCNTCNKDFSSRFNLNRHIASIHSKSMIGSGLIGSYIVDKPDTHSDVVSMGTNFRQCGPLYFVHPFTCIVSAPTKSGKTEFVKKLILHREALMKPTRTKIIWAYVTVLYIFMCYITVYYI